MGGVLSPRRPRGNCVIAPRWVTPLPSSHRLSWLRTSQLVVFCCCCPRARTRATPAPRPRHARNALNLWPRRLGYLPETKPFVERRSPSHSSIAARCTKASGSTRQRDTDSFNLQVAGRTCSSTFQRLNKPGLFVWTPGKNADIQEADERKMLDQRNLGCVIFVSC
jgi:hypothetical protein